MKIRLAAIALSLTAAAAALPANAESSYWDKRYQRNEVPEARPALKPRFATRSRVERSRMSETRRPYRSRRYVERDARVGDAVPNPFRVERNDGRAHPTMNNDYWLQSSIYDFNDGKAADLKHYRY